MLVWPPEDSLRFVCHCQEASLAALSATSRGVWQQFGKSIRSTDKGEATRRIARMSALQVAHSLGQARERLGITGELKSWDAAMDCIGNLESALYTEVRYVHGPDWDLKPGKLVSRKGTWLKESTQFSWELQEPAKMYIPHGIVMPVVQIGRIIDPAELKRHEWSGQHLRVWLNPPIVRTLQARKDVWFVYWPHWQMEGLNAVAQVDTWLKRSTQMSGEMSPFELIYVPKGLPLRLLSEPAVVDEEWERDRHAHVRQHRRFHLASAPRTVKEDKYDILVGQSEEGRAAVEKQKDPAAVLRECGYEYRGGRLLQLGKDEGFKFQDQDHYDKLADAVLRYVEVALGTEGKLKALYCPVGATATTGCPVYVSAGFERASKLLLILQGSGRVRVGVWGCALCINEDLDRGSMLPYIKRAEADGYGLVILNPNLNEVNGTPIPGSDSPERHVCYVWKEIVLKLCSPAAPVDIVAHSNGGRGTLDFLRLVGDAPLARIRKVVFTDSYHSIDQVEALTPAARKMLVERSVNYVPHSAPFGTPVPSWVTLRHTMEAADKGCPCLSCAVDEHASTNHGALAAAFEFFAKP